jgi:hypothetical protein
MKYKKQNYLAVSYFVDLLFFLIRSITPTLHYPIIPKYSILPVKFLYLLQQLWDKKQQRFHKGQGPGT